MYLSLKSAKTYEKHERKKLYHLILGLTEGLENGLQEIWSRMKEQGFTLLVSKQIHLKV